MSALSPLPVSSPSLTPPPLPSIVPPPSNASSTSPPEQPVSVANPPSTSPPPPTVDTSPPPAAPPPSIPSSPPPISVSPPTVDTSPPPAVPPPSIPSSPPPISVSAPPPQVASPPPPILSSAPPPQVASPPPPIPVSAPPPQVSSPPPSIPSSPPPDSSPPAPPIPSSPPVQPPPDSSPPPPIPSPPPPPSPVKSPPTVPSSSPPPPPINAPPPVSPSPPSAAISPPPSQDNVPPPPSLSPPVSASPPKSSPALQSPPPPPPKSHSPPKVSPPTSTPKSPPPHIQPLPTSPSPPNSSIPGTPAIPPATSPNISTGGDTSTGPSSAKPVEPNITTLSPPTGSRSSGIKAGTAVGVGLGVGVVLLSVIGLLVWFMRRQKRRPGGFHGNYVIPSSTTPSQISDFGTGKTLFPLLGASSGSSFKSHPTPDRNGLGNSKSWFTYEELLDITYGFSDQNLLGEGGFGSVYKGCLPDGRQVAVKQLKIGGGQGEREFKAEVEIISRVHHRHLVSLVGYCISEHQRLLVYDYVPNNTLYYHLHGEGRPVMHWATRVKVAVGAARGIAYLHEDCHPRIIHRDIKTSNILLDDNFEAQVSDFGLAKLALDANTHVTTRVMGTFGYMAPEYASSGKLTDRSDVFSFGVVLLELITGRKPVDTSQPVGDESLVEWARPLLSNALENEDLEKLVDPRLGNNYVGSEMLRMVEAAAACVRHSAVKRPRMGQVVRALEFGDSSDLSNGMIPGQSTMFDSSEHSLFLRRFEMLADDSQDYSTGDHSVREN